MTSCLSQSSSLTRELPLTQGGMGDDVMAERSNLVEDKAWITFSSVGSEGFV